MFFASAEWLVLLALPALLLVLHALRAGARAWPVSSMLLWRGVPRRTLRRRRLRLPPLTPPLILALSVLVLLALAAADPWTGATPPPSFTVVLDLPFDDDERRARDTALALLRERTAASHRLLIVAGDPPLHVSSSSSNDRPFEQALEEDRRATGGGPAPLEDLVRAAVWAAGLRGGGRVAVVSDFATGSDRLPSEDPLVANGTVALEAVALDAGPSARGVPEPAFERAGGPYVIEPRAERPMPPELNAAIEALNGRADTPAAPAVGVALFYALELPDELPERWVHVSTPDEEHRVDGDRRTAPVALDLVRPAGDMLAAFHPIVIDASKVRDAEPPAGASPLALAGGRTVLARVERGAARGVWWGVAPEDTDLVARGALPLALDAVVRSLLEPRVVSASRDSGEVPDGAVPAVEVLARARRPWRLRGPLSVLALLLLAAEAWRRVATTRDRRSAGDDSVPTGSAPLHVAARGMQ